MMDQTVLFISIGTLLVALSPFLSIFLLRALFIRRVGPNQVMVVYGAGGTKIIIGGSHIVLPRFHQAKYFSLELMSFVVDLVQELYLAEHEMRVQIEAVVLIKVCTSEPDIALVIEELQSKNPLTREGLLQAINENTAQQSVLRAVELFLDKSPSEREALIRLIIEVHLRGLIGQRTFEALVQEPEAIVQEMFKTTAADLSRMGLEMVAFTMKGIHRRSSGQANEA